MLEGVECKNPADYVAFIDAVDGSFAKDWAAKVAPEEYLKKCDNIHLNRVKALKKVYAFSNFQVTGKYKKCMQSTFHSSISFYLQLFAFSQWVQCEAIVALT